ncbi:phage minor head protein [Pseudarthrobacter sp. NPDC092439]|uniref:phage minor head protein n=1 Tax=unclassified Pseudarthrobacter TaxID=2647000 RepID=UPI003814A781
MPFTPETQRISDDTRRALDAVMGDHTRALTKAWVEAWDYLQPEFEASFAELMLAAKDGRLSHRQVDQNVRLAKTLELAREALEELADGIEPLVADDLGPVTTDAYKAHISAIASQLPAEHAGIVIAWEHASADAMEAIVTRSLQQIHKDTRPLAADVERLMKNELIRAVALGDNPNRTAARIIRNAENKFNGGLTRALVISRNEVLDAHRAAAKVSEERNRDIMAGWRWSAALTARTCPSCLANHGTLHPVEEPGPLDHHQGRCARVPVTKSWAELGFKGMDEPADEFPDARQWFDGLTPETQAAIMGRERLKLLDDGKVSWDDLTTRTKNGQWRDSMTVTPVSVLKAKAAQ